MPTTYVTIDGYAIDCVATETHQLDTDVTDHPVEEGADVSDNARAKPRILTLSNAIVSNTPLGILAQVRSINVDDDGNLVRNQLMPSDDARARLEAIRDAREPVTVETSTRTYDNMIMQTLNIPKDAKTGNALVFTAVFKEVIIVANDRALVPVASPELGNKTHLGAKASVTQTAPYYAYTNSKSILGEGITQLGNRNEITVDTIKSLFGLNTD